MNKTNEIETVAAELGYTEHMECSALNYIIETAKASVMVNQKNVELMARLVELNKLHSDLTNADMVCDEDENHIGYVIENEQIDEMERLLSADAQCLNQIKAEAGRAGFIAGIDWFCVDGEFELSETPADQYAEKIRKGDL
jgi:hypothetical protein